MATATRPRSVEEISGIGTCLAFGCSPEKAKHCTHNSATCLRMVDIETEVQNCTTCAHGKRPVNAAHMTIKKGYSIYDRAPRCQKHGGRVVEGFWKFRSMKCWEAR